jgi:hypothetical protein
VEHDNPRPVNRNPGRGGPRPGSGRKPNLIVALQSKVQKHRAVAMMRQIRTLALLQLGIISHSDIAAAKALQRKITKVAQNADINPKPIEAARIKAAVRARGRGGPRPGSGRKPFTLEGCLNAQPARFSNNLKAQQIRELSAMIREIRRKIRSERQPPRPDEKRGGPRLGSGRPSVKGGRPRGMSKVTIEEAQALEYYRADFINTHGIKRGSMLYASRRVYGTGIESRIAISRAHKTLGKYRAVFTGQ